MLTKCVSCGFYVRQDDEFCFDCGINDPSDKVYWKYFNTRIFLKLIVPFFLFFVLIISISSNLRETTIIWLIVAIAIAAIIYSLLLSLIVTCVYEYIYFKFILNKNVACEDSLKSKTKIINKRLSELENRKNQLNNVTKQIKSNDGKNLQTVRQRLLSANQVVFNQFIRYELQKHKIEVVRLQNSVSIYLFSLHCLTNSETKEGLVKIKSVIYEINRIRQKLASYGDVEFSERINDERATLRSQLKKTNSTCNKLREALLSKQAAQALEGFSPIEENLKLPSAKEIVHSVETFNIQTTLTDFSESFEELEREYRRVRAESEVSQKLLEN